MKGSGLSLPTFTEVAIHSTVCCSNFMVFKVNVSVLSSNLESLKCSLNLENTDQTFLKLTSTVGKDT